MPYILRNSNETSNPTLAGGVYAKNITIGKAVYYRWDGMRTRGIIFISDGGKYGLDRVTEVSYKGNVLAQGDDWIFHRGTIPKQIEPKNITNISGSTFTANNHGFVNGDNVRLRSVNGDLPQPIPVAIHGQSGKYEVTNATANTFQLDGVTLTSTGSGQIIVWKADSGFDDPEQGNPSFVPEVQSTFNNIAYIEFKLPNSMSSADEQPDWLDFRIILVGRRLMDYDENGNELGVIAGDDNLLANTPLQIADNDFWNHKIKKERYDFASFKQFRDAANALIWQRVEPNTDGTGTGFTARYYQNLDFTDLRVTREDATINAQGSIGASPAPGVNANGFSVEWSGRIKPAFSQTYTFFLQHDWAGEVWVNSQRIINGTSVGTTTGQITLVAGQDYDILVKGYNDRVSASANDWKFILEWQSASQPKQVVPGAVVFASDKQVRRYENHMGFNSQTEAAEVRERMFSRCPGWDWTDDNGKIVFLPPDRPVSFAFTYDRIDDDSAANFVNKTFEKKKRSLEDRKNFRLFKFRNVENAGYPVAYTQSDRESLRRLNNGEPSNDDAIDLGVMTRSLAERIAEMEMVLKTDPKDLAQILGFLDSSKIRKNHIVTVSYYDENGNYVADERYLVTFHSWGAPNNANQFNLLPIPEEFYKDEPVV